MKERKEEEARKEKDAKERKEEMTMGKKGNK